jgi:hypothetical protein
MKSRHSHMFVFALIFIAVSVINTGLFSLNAQPSQVHLSLSAEKKHKATVPVTVTWCSDIDHEKQWVKYGLATDLKKTVKAGSTSLNGKLVFNACLRKLKHGMKYYYKCGSDEAGWSPMYSFNSEPDTGTFRVAVIGDTQNSTNNAGFSRTKQITDLVRTYTPSFTLHVGDIVENGSIPASWIQFLSVTEELNAISPLMPVLGNHDVENKEGDDFQKPYQDFYTLFTLPGDEVNYSFTYRNVRFIGIFSGYAQGAEKTGQVKYKPGSSEYVWLDNELKAAEEARNIGWTVVWMHYPVRSFGWSSISSWQKNVFPLLEKHHVDLCLAGHRHVYERHLQMKDGVPVKNESGSTFLSSGGTIFITNGTAGGNPTGSGGRDLPTMAFTTDKPMYSFGIMDIGTKSLTYHVFDQDSTMVDKFIILKNQDN